MAGNEISMKNYMAKIQSGTLEGEITQEAKDILVQAMHANLNTAADNAPVDSGFLRDELRNGVNNLKITDKDGVFKVRSVVEVYDDKDAGKNTNGGFPYGIYQNANHKSKNRFLQKGLDSAKNVLARLSSISIIKIKGGK